MVFKLTLRIWSNLIKTTREIFQFLPLFNLGDNIVGTYTDTKLMHKYEHLFF